MLNDDLRVYLKCKNQKEAGAPRGGSKMAYSWKEQVGYDKWTAAI